MIRPLLLSLLLLLQGIPVQQGGTITGVLRSADGKPAAGVRIGAVPQTDSLEETAAGPTLSSIAETDAEGRYKLEDVPPGRYFIAAGRLDLPTYFPGTQSMALGRAVLITPGLSVSGIDFVLNANSAGRADPGNAQGIVILTLPFEVRVEGGGKLPLLSGGKPTTVQLTPLTGATSPITFPINAGRLSISPPIVDYRVSVENLPEGYTVKSIKADSKELPDRTLKLLGFTTRTGPLVFTGVAAYAAFMTASNSVPAGTSVFPLQSLSIVLDSAGVSSIRNAGARVTGSLPSSTIRTLYLNGAAASTVFADGTFEFRNVPPGYHSVVTLDNSPSVGPLAASFVVGSTDLTNVEVAPAPALPFNSKSQSSTKPAGERNPGAVPLAALRGRVIDAETGTPVNAGTLFVVGDTYGKFDLSVNEGKFEFRNLLPGSYEIEVQGVGYPTFRRPLVVGEDDITLELKAN